MNPWKVLYEENHLKFDRVYFLSETKDVKIWQHIIRKRYMDSYKLDPKSLKLKWAVIQLLEWLKTPVRPNPRTLLKYVPYTVKPMSRSNKQGCNVFAPSMSPSVDHNSLKAISL